MLEIIGWIGCLYLLVKGFEIVGNQSNRVPRFEEEGTRMSIPAVIAALLAFCGAFVFPLVLSAQVNGVRGDAIGTATATTAPALNQAEIDCINNAGSDSAKVLACTQ